MAAEPLYLYHPPTGEPDVTRYIRWLTKRGILQPVCKHLSPKPHILIYSPSKQQECGGPEHVQ